MMPPTIERLLIIVLGELIIVLALAAFALAHYTFVH